MPRGRGPLRTSLRAPWPGTRGSSGVSSGYGSRVQRKVTLSILWDFVPLPQNNHSLKNG